MPQIKEYNQQTNAPGPGNFTQVRGSDISGGMGNNLKAAGEMLGEVNDIFAKKEMEAQTFEAQKLSMKEAADINDFMQETKMKAPPGAAGFAKTAQEELEKRKQKLLDEAPSEFIRNNLSSDLIRIHGNAFKQAVDFEAESMAKKSKEDTVVLLNRANNSVRSNPALIGSVLEEQEKLIDSSPIDATTKLAWKNKARQDLRQSEIRGWMDVNPHKAQAMLQEGTWDKDLDPDLKNTLLHETRQGIRALEIENNRSKKLDEEVKSTRREAIKDNFIGKAASGELSAREVISSDLPSADKEHLLRALKNDSLNVKNASNASVFNDTVERINLPDGDPRKITSDAQIMSMLGKGITYKDAQHLRKELAGTGTEEGKQEAMLKKGIDDIAKGFLTKSNGMGFKDPEGDAQLQRWRIFMSKEYESGKQKGLTPMQMLDPDSKEYIGRHLKTPAFQRTQEQVMNSVFNKMAPPERAAPAPDKVVAPITAAPRAPGESAAAYLARTKKG